MRCEHANGVAVEAKQVWQRMIDGMVQLESVFKRLLMHDGKRSTLKTWWSRATDRPQAWRVCYALPPGIRCRK